MHNKPLIGYGVLSQQDCQEAIDFCLHHAEKSDGKVGGLIENESYEYEYDKNVRDVTVYTPPKDMSEYELSRYGFNIHNFFKPILDANYQYFDFEIEGSLEFHILKYEVGGHYNLHCDIGNTRTVSVSSETRKLSFSVFLNEDFEGGDLVFSGIPSEHYMKPDTPCKTGDIIVFPSYLYHEVKPVTSGVRWVGVGWFHGKNPFK